MSEDIKSSLKTAELKLKKLRETNTRFIVISLIASVLATLLAGSTAFLGPLAGQGPPAWKWTCGIVALFTATATVFTGLHKQLTVSERLAKVTECVGKLRSIDFSYSNAVSEEEKKSSVTEYKKTLEVYGEFLV
ncbi:MAG: hypothetical protein HGGPFJEG_01678 [Ignavibacteria bacterium]|nr:hypothetical protein [Ignavibacteria bacterium]